MGGTPLWSKHSGEVKEGTLVWDQKSWHLHPHGDTEQTAVTKQEERPLSLSARRLRWRECFSLGRTSRHFAPQTLVGQLNPRPLSLNQNQWKGVRLTVGLGSLLSSDVNRLTLCAELEDRRSV